MIAPHHSLISNSIRCGVLALQGCVDPHLSLLQSLGVSTLKVRAPEELDDCDALILPGGESTTMLRLLHSCSLFEPLREFCQRHPVWGICAGSILMAQEVCSPQQESLEVMAIRAHRNYYGSQLQSFHTELTITGLELPMGADFIRAPRLEVLAGRARPSAPPVIVLAEHQGKSVLLRQGHLFASSFHVELGTDWRLHELFLRTGLAATEHLAIGQHDTAQSRAA